MEEQQSLVGRSDSEGSRFGTMTFAEHPPPLTDAAGDADHIPPAGGSTDSHESELLGCGDSSLRDQFHDDALAQAGCGLSQARVLLSCGLAVAGSSIELYAIPFILPSAEIELCILPHEKNWLVLISLVGSSLGAVGWGALAERLGRRRALQECLAVNCVFAAIAAFMPTYGTFMMARFCSALGSGGIVPISYTYCGEMTSRANRRSLAALLGAAGGGALLTALLAAATLPQTGALTLIENKEHFSAWHRYLLLCTLPILAALVCLIWTQESPRYLLDAGREVDAMVVYQRIHNSNQTRLCGAKPAAVPTASPPYRLGELSLPGNGKRPSPHHVTHSIKMFWQAYFQLFSTAHRRSTLSLAGTLLFIMAIQFYLSSFIPSTVIRLENAEFEASKRSIFNVTFTNDHFNRTLENIQYDNVTFVNCTFRDMLMSHVSFANCSFYEVAFSNIKTSYTLFVTSQFVNCSIIDTEFTTNRELQDCTLTNTVTRAVRAACPRRPELAYTLSGLQTEQEDVSNAMLIAVVLALLPEKMRPSEVSCVICILLSPALYLAQSETALYLIEAAYRLLISVVYFNVCSTVVDTFPSNLRCTAHGLIMGGAVVGGAVVRGAGAAGPAVSAVLAGGLAAAAMACSALR